MSAHKTAKTIAFILLLLPAVALGVELDRSVHFQGMVYTSGGAPAAGTYSMTFRLFVAPAGGAALWEKTYPGVEVEGGLFDVQLGPIPTGKLEPYPSVWVETQVESEVLPRAQVLPCAYALVAQQANHALSCEELLCSSCVSDDAVAFDWALGTSKGGAAADLDCETCVSGAELVGETITSAHVKNGSLSKDDVAFAYAGSGIKGGPATGVACVGPCIESGELDANLSLAGNVTVSGSLGACQPGYPGCAVTSNGALLVAGTLGVGMSQPPTHPLQIEGNDTLLTVRETTTEARVGIGGVKNPSNALELGPYSDRTISGLRNVGFDGTSAAGLSTPGRLSLRSGSGVFLLPTGVNPGGDTYGLTVRHLRASGANPGDDVLAVQRSDGTQALAVKGGGNVGVGTSTPASLLSVAGGVQVGLDTGECTEAKSGTLRWTGTAIEVCDGAEWSEVAATSSAGDGSSEATAGKTCRTILDAGLSTGSGFYWINPKGEPALPVKVYCDMVTDGGGWTRVADVDPAAAACPGEWATLSSPKVCHRNTATAACKSASFDTLGIAYDEVRGFAKAYQYYSMDAFHMYNPSTIDGTYVDGVSITYGSSPRTHVWTYAVGVSEDGVYPDYNCPCSSTPGGGPPSFVGTHYYCESGNSGDWEGVWYTADPLFDGAGCPSGNTCCSNGALPWFARGLSEQTLSPLEVRLCSDQESANEDVGLARLELFVREPSAQEPGVADGSSKTKAAPSCKSILDQGYSKGDGMYWVDPDGGSTSDAVQVYCDMTTNGGGWTRIADVDPSVSSCPGNWALLADPKVCYRNTPSAGCRSATFDALGLSYKEVRGYVRAYQYYSMDAFHMYNPFAIDDTYVDGVSITFGQSPRKHVWTYAVGVSEDGAYPDYTCPCSKTPGGGPPGFVGTSYYCESGNTGDWEGIWYTADPLYDGTGCPSGNSCCTPAGLPWFTTNLGQTTTSALEARLCSDQESANEDVGVFRMELFVR